MCRALPIVSGWMLGIGAEYALWDNWTAKIEYNMMDFGNSGPFADDKFNVVKAGINYRFGGAGCPDLSVRISRCDVSTLPSKPALPGRLCFVPKADISSDRRSIPTERSLFPCPEFLPDPKCCEHE